MQARALNVFGITQAICVLAASAVIMAFVGVGVLVAMALTAVATKIGN